jgi:hypothetical protein
VAVFGPGLGLQAHALGDRPVELPLRVGAQRQREAFDLGRGVGRSGVISSSGSSGSRLGSSVSS